VTIRYVRGNLLHSPAAFLVIPVNCRGVAGCGLARECKERYPRWFVDYQAACRMGHLAPGKITYYVEEISRWQCRRFLNLPTKEHWRDPARLEYIEAGVVAVVDFLKRREGQGEHVAFPKLGCGAGGLAWEWVRPVMECYLRSLNCLVDIFL
jgi:O-acetyl-ADP-ribose deacetylase (regulator of RNase III)